MESNKDDEARSLLLSEPQEKDKNGDKGSIADGNSSSQYRVDTSKNTYSN